MAQLAAMRTAVLLLALGLILCSLAAAAALAQPGPGPGPHPGGGAASLFISPCGEPFRSKAGEPYPVAAWFAKADADHDGAVTRAEFRADADRFFTVLDLNHDGVISGQEVDVYEISMVPEVMGRQQVGDAGGRIIRVQDDEPIGEVGGGGAGRPQGETGPFREMTGAAAFNLLREPEPVSAADMDFNGRITRAEFQASADRRFALLDMKGDGRLTLDELPRTVIQDRGLAGGRPHGGGQGHGGRGGGGRHGGWGGGMPRS